MKHTLVLACGLLALAAQGPAAAQGVEARIGQLESRLNAALNRIQALENKLAQVRRVGDRLEFSSNNIVFSGAVSVHGRANLNGDTNIRGALDVGRTLTVHGITTLAADSFVQGNFDVERALMVRGATTLAATTLQGNLSVGGTLGVSGVSNLGANLMVSGSAMISRDLELGTAGRRNTFFFEGGNIHAHSLNSVSLSFDETIRNWPRTFMVDGANMHVWGGRPPNVGLGNLFLGNGDTTGSTPTFRQANVGSISNSLVMGSQHFVAWGAVDGALISGIGHTLNGGFGNVVLGGSFNTVGMDYTWALGGINNSVTMVGAGQAGGASELRMGADMWRTGVGDQVFNP